MTRSELCSCHGKAAFADRALAQRAAARIRGRIVYRCEWCRQWHVGTADRRIRRDPFKRESWHWREALAEFGA
jgi:hypothetical protein